MIGEDDVKSGAQPGLKKRALRRLSVTLVCLGAILFLSAGSLRFWQGWVFLLLMAGSWAFFFVSLWKSDPRALERRLQRKETEPEQELFQKLSVLIMIPGFVLTGLDFRFGWSLGWFGAVPYVVVWTAQAVVLGSYWLVFWVIKTNTFAATVIQVEQEHRVIERGPYAWVRHPMYLGLAIAMLGAPLALGSYVLLPWFALYVPLLAYRLIHEERTLRRDLPGYAEYCERTRFRMVPGVW